MTKDAADSNWFYKSLKDDAAELDRFSTSSLKDDRVHRMIDSEAQRVAMNKICSELAEDTVSVIGIYGMPGVGKTTLAKRIYNWVIRERPHMFRYVYWISMSPVSGIYELQNVMAKATDIDITADSMRSMRTLVTDVLDLAVESIHVEEMEESEEQRAELLSKALSKKGNLLLILDDLHTEFSLEKVGIPTSESGCKLILTTRSLEICENMGCQEATELACLTPAEALNLFMMKLGLDVEIPLELKSIARSIIEGCTRLPLEVIAMAGSMKGLNHVHEWERARFEFEMSRVQPHLKRRKIKLEQRDREPEIFSTLLACYRRLHVHRLQRCLLHCALFPKYFKIKRVDLIEHMIAEEIIPGWLSRQEQLEEGNAMLDILERRHLLEGYGEEKNQRYVVMHDVVRDMALQILEDLENSKAVVETDLQLKQFPYIKELSKTVRVSLMKNCFSYVYVGLRSSQLSTLLLCKNPNLKHIDQYLFLNLPMLKVLDLSGTSLQAMPPSLGSLYHLRALFLKRCKQLRYVPSLEGLKLLSMLDLSYTGIEKVPDHLDHLRRLKYLNLYETRLKKFPKQILPRLSRLQFLKFCQTGDIFPELKGDEVACLRKLEVLQCRFNDIYEFNNYILSGKIAESVRNYNLLIGSTDCDEGIRDDFMAYYYCRGSNADIGKEIWIFNCSINSGEFVVLPESIQHLAFVKCDDALSLYEVEALRFATQLKSMEIWECGGMRSLLSSFSETLKNLEVLRLRCLNSLEVLYPTESPSYECYGAFSSLKTFTLSRCPLLKKLFCPGLLSNLLNLEVIEVENCALVEEIIAMDSSDTDKVSLPKLRILKLKRLPELKSICCRKVLCDDLQEIHIIECWKLEGIPFIGEHDNIPASLKRIQAFPKAWWNWIEWGSPDAKNAVQSLCVFDDADFFMEDEQKQYFQYNS